MLQRHHVRMMAIAACLTLSAGIAARLEAQGTPSEAQRRFIGNWQGALHAGGVALRLVLSVSADSAGGLAGMLTSIDQGGATLPLTVRVSGDSIRAESAPIGAAFTGRLVTADSLDGTWSQGGASLPLALARAATGTATRRSREPRAPSFHARHAMGRAAEQTRGTPRGITRTSS